MTATMISPDEVAERLGIRVRHAQRLMASGELAATKVGRLWRTTTEAVDDYLSAEKPNRQGMHSLLFNHPGMVALRERRAKADTDRDDAVSKLAGATELYYEDLRRSVEAGTAPPAAPSTEWAIQQVHQHTVKKIDTDRTAFLVDEGPTLLAAVDGREQEIIEQVQELAEELDALAVEATELARVRAQVRRASNPGDQGTLTHVSAVNLLAAARVGSTDWMPGAVRNP
jgi:excisionase family DNA binding protein